jgi:hypothetical protein
MYIKKGEENNLVDLITNYVCLNCLKEAISEENFNYKCMDLSRRIKREILPLYEGREIINFEVNTDKFEIII